jgi:hypothetical protein
LCENIETSIVTSLPGRSLLAERSQVFLTIDDLENVSGSHFDNALRAMDKISRYETRALSKRRRVVGKAPSD